MLFDVEMNRAINQQLNVTTCTDWRAESHREMEYVKWQHFYDWINNCENACLFPQMSSSHDDRITSFAKNLISRDVGGTQIAQIFDDEIFFLQVLIPRSESQ